ncbi:hypothetical protein BZZ01_23365 [Nostocales cyanobacterium HT-58-2]|nr:hypothetical protein BZZ01_23365 [Nostocales cyanobacterium HT-58-2]
MGKKRLKNVPILYEGIKKKRAIGLTDTAYQNLQEAAAAEKLCLSEFVETWARQLKLQRIHESALKEGFQRQMLHLGKHARCYNAGNPRNALQDRTGSSVGVWRPHTFKVWAFCFHCCNKESNKG